MPPQMHRCIDLTEQVTELGGWMRLRLGRPTVMAAAVVAAVSVGIAHSPSTDTTTDSYSKNATYGQNATVGALFSLTPAGKLDKHFCTASVVDSPAGDLVVTAAHCVSSSTPGTEVFVPEYSDGQEPFGVWTISRVVMDPSWTSSGDPDDDFAFLIVHQPGTKASLQELTGAEAIGIGLAAGRTVEVAGYPDAKNEPISCENTALAYSATQFEFDCGGFTGGTSGSPLLAAAEPGGGFDTVIGVIGGYEHGGATPSVSYAARFNVDLAALYQTALAASALRPAAGSSG
jgi:V8-like Glu-specific endopeptidase